MDEYLDIPEDVLRTLRRDLKDFSPPGPRHAAPASGAAVSVSPEDAPVPRALRYLLTSVLGLRDHGQSEKTAWEIDFEFHGVPMTMAHRKFGVRVEIWGTDRSGDEIATVTKTLLARLRSAVRTLDRAVLLPAATVQLNAGNVTIGNKHHQLRGAYQYFRDAVGECLEGKGRWSRDEEMRKRLFWPQQEGFINLTAAVQAYFSWLEHVLILVLPFVGFDPSRDDLRALIGSSWRDKFKRVFDVSTDVTANRLFSELVDLSEDVRNTWGHGAFDKGAGLLFVHLPEVGAAPLRVSEFEKNVHFGWIPALNFDFNGVWELLDRVDTHLRTAKTSFGLRYAEAWLQVMFNPAARADYDRATASADAFEEFIEHCAYTEDMIDNMDW